MIYIGIKLVNAYPETKEGQEGYCVIYENGYQSWCPKEQFEKHNIYVTNRTDLPVNVLKLMGQRVQQIEHIHEITNKLLSEEVNKYSSQYIDSLSNEIKQRNSLIDIFNQRLAEMGYPGV